MTSLMISLLTVTSIAMEAPVLVVAAVIAVGMLLPVTDRADEPTIGMDCRTRADIGIAPGSITWLRS